MVRSNRIKTLVSYDYTDVNYFKPKLHVRNTKISTKIFAQYKSSMILITVPFGLIGLGLLKYIIQIIRYSLLVIQFTLHSILSSVYFSWNHIVLKI